MSERLAEPDVKKLLFKLSLPAMTGMFVMALYNLVDTVFVGRGVGTLGIAGLSIVFPIQMIVMSIGMLFGIGGASVISRYLGAGKRESAERAYGNITVSALFTGVLLSVFGLTFQTGILNLFGASPDILPIATDYYQIIIFASPFFVSAMTGNNVLRSVGLAKSAMTTMITGATLNIILDPVFIFALDMGVRGAALATVISQAASVSYLAYELRPSKSRLRLTADSVKISLPIIREVTSIGFSSFIRSVASSFVFALVNNRLLDYGTDVSVAAYGVAVRLSRFLILPLIGVAQGLQPIVGFNHGADNPERVIRACKTGLLWGSVVSIFGFLLAQLFPSQLTSLFTEDPRLLRAGAESLRIVMLGLWAVGFHIVGTSIFQALGKAGESILLSLSREVLFFIPSLLILPGIFGLEGVWYSIPVADMLAFSVTLLMIMRERKRYLALTQ